MDWVEVNEGGGVVVSSAVAWRLRRGLGIVAFVEASERDRGAGMISAEVYAVSRGVWVNILVVARAFAACLHFDGQFFGIGLGGTRRDLRDDFHSEYSSDSVKPAYISN